MEPFDITKKIEYTTRGDLSTRIRKEKAHTLCYYCHEGLLKHKSTRIRKMKEKKICNHTDL